MAKNITKRGLNVGKADGNDTGTREKEGEREGRREGEREREGSDV